MNALTLSEFHLSFKSSRNTDNTARGNHTMSDKPQTDLFASLIKEREELKLKIAEAAQSKKDELKQNVTSLAALLGMTKESLLSELFPEELAAAIAEELAAAIAEERAAAKASASTTAVSSSGDRKQRSVNGGITLQDGKDMLNPLNIKQQAKDGGAGKTAAWPAEVLKDVRKLYQNANEKDVVQICKELYNWAVEEEEFLNELGADKKATAKEKIKAPYEKIVSDYFKQKEIEQEEVQKTQAAKA